MSVPQGPRRSFRFELGEVGDAEEEKKKDRGFLFLFQRERREL